MANSPANYLNAYPKNGVLIAELADGSTTRYTQDRAAPLNQVLTDGSAS